MAKKRGAKPNHYVTDDGKTIVGLTRRSNGRFYPTGKDRPSFGSDPDLAIFRFRQWQAQNEFKDAWDKHREQHAPPAPVRYGDTSIPMISFVMDDAKLYKSYIRNLILTKPHEAAKELDIRELQWFDQLRAPGPSLQLPELGEQYASKKKRISAKWQSKVKNYWDRFVAVVDKQTLAEVTADDISRYHDVVWEEFEQDERSPTYVIQRFDAVKTVLNHAMKRGEDQKEIRRVLDLCAMFTKPDQHPDDPRPIDPDDFEKLLNVSDAKWKTFLLMALNCAMYPGEVAAIKKDEVDLKKKTLATRRSKTGVVRIAVLWDRTVNAVREYQRGFRHESEYLFVNQNGAPYDANHVTRNFRRRRQQAELPESVTFDQIRDGAYTAAIEAGVPLETAKLLAGHKTGISDKYAKRRPKMVEDACRAVEEYYFG